MYPHRHTMENIDIRCADMPICRKHHLIFDRLSK
nr:MAG TPA: hypothetical protein [Caudoviricetes sp.]